MRARLPTRTGLTAARKSTLPSWVRSKSNWPLPTNQSHGVLVWAFADWPTWAAYEASHDDPSTPIATWRRSVADLVTSWERTLLVDAELAPLRLGRQPEIADRRPLDDL